MTDEQTSQEMVSAGTSLVLPHTGEIIDLRNPRECAEAVEGLRALKARIDDLVRQLTDAVAVVSEERGGLDGTGAVLKTSDEIRWDVQILRELLHPAGLPTDRWDELVTQTVDYKVDARVAARIAKANPVYAEIIDRACTRTPRRPSVSTT